MVFLAVFTRVFRHSPAFVDDSWRWNSPLGSLMPVWSGNTLPLFVHQRGGRGPQNVWLTWTNCCICGRQERLVTKLPEVTGSEGDLCGLGRRGEGCRRCLVFRPTESQVATMKRECF